MYRKSQVNCCTPRANMGRGMIITRPIWKCPCIKLFITYFRHLEKIHPFWPECIFQNFSKFKKFHKISKSSTNNKIIFFFKVQNFQKIQNLKNKKKILNFYKIS